MPDDYKQSDDYIRATPQEQQWFDVFFETKDIKAASYAAFRVKTDESAYSYGRKVMSRPHIDSLIRTFTVPDVPLPTQDDLRRLYFEISRVPTATPREKLMALTAYERVSGFNKVKPAITDEFDILDDIVDEK
jgi:hypothetical protein